ncbi:hypothetical protein DSO57_1012284 [Entomophthora muscae]|uniref:Uncharacterized protein n=1 Tax=Entomophthora muscae TaxID=34485 RepID=A0ACC2TTR4_9FUNG|nr:hypothetical protein DSO57_1012284 [Entomophthora muscae]
MNYPGLISPVDTSKRAFYAPIPLRRPRPRRLRRRRIHLPSPRYMARSRRAHMACRVCQRKLRSRKFQPTLIKLKLHQLTA